MKRILWLSSVLALLSLGACGQSATATKTATDASDVATQDLGNAVDSTAVDGLAADATAADATAADTVVDNKTYKATIRWTSYGVPHITADSFGNVGFGQGYAFARDNACILADQIVKVRSERSLYFGRDVAGTKDANYINDFAYKALQVVDHAKTSYAKLSGDGRELLDGYVAGYNHRLAEVGTAGLPAACQNAAWVKPITAIDLLAYYHDLALYASGRNFRSYLADAQPPTAVTRAMPWPSLLLDMGKAPQQLAAMLPDFRHLDIGSNGWALGSEKSSNGKGLVLANPHFPWFGELKLWECQLTVPGKLDVAGATLMGVAGVLIGHNQHVAWTHTVSASQRFTAYKLTLQPNDPTTYLVDGKPHKMSKHDETVQYKDTDGSIKSETRSFYRTDWGPLAAVPAVGDWTDTSAFALRDGNEDNGTMVDHWLGLAKADSVDALQTAIVNTQGNPWTNTMAADDQGNTLYSECNSTPNVSDATMKAFYKILADGTDFPVTAAAAQGVILLDGSNSSNDWVIEPGSRVPGLVPWAKTPHLVRKDFVFNANDSHWLTNPANPLVGYPQTYGPEKTQRSARTRMNLKMLLETGASAASGDDGKFTWQELQDVVMNDRVWLAENLRDQLVARCSASGSVSFKLGKHYLCTGGKDDEPACATATSQTIDISGACTILKNWNGRFHVSSAGAALFREWLSYFPAKVILKNGFDVKNPQTTPSDLADAPGSGADPALAGLALAQASLAVAKFAPDVPLGQAQFADRAGARVAIHGGKDAEGAFNVVEFGNSDDTLLPHYFAQQFAGNYGTLRKDGYPVNRGSSFMMVVQFTATGPQAVALLSYGQSPDPASADYTNQTQLFSQAQFRPMPFTDADIAADPNLKTQTVSNAQ